MGYSTDFTGELKFHRELKASQIAELNKYLGKDRREIGWGDDEKAYKTGGGYWYHINLEFTDDYSGLKWNGSEKTYDLQHIVNFLIARMKEKWPDFRLVGELSAQGESVEDRWVLKMNNNVAEKIMVQITGDVIICPHCESKIVVAEAEKTTFDSSEYGDDEEDDEEDEEDEENEDEDYFECPECGEPVDEEGMLCDECELTDLPEPDYQTVKIVKENGKLRAKWEGDNVRFPRDKRIEGAEYSVEELREGKGGSWIACGKIVRVK